MMEREKKENQDERRRRRRRRRWKGGGRKKVALNVGKKIVKRGRWSPWQPRT